MKILDLKQGSDEWKEWRSGGIGASDIAVIMGTNTYKTKKQLWEEKCGYRDEEPLNTAMAHGIKCEPVARSWIAKRYDMHLETICVEDQIKGHFRASLDGFDYEANCVVEIKSPINEKVLDAARTGSIPIHYIDQVQWQIGLTGAEKGLIGVWDHRTETCYMFEIKPDLPRIRQMRAAADEFWIDVKLGKCPENGKGEYDVVENDEVYSILEQLIHMNTLIKDQQVAFEMLKLRYFEMNDGKPFAAYGSKVIMTEPRKTYDVAKMIEDGIDLSKYEKKGNPSFRLQLPS